MFLKSHNPPNLNRPPPSQPAPKPTPTLTTAVEDETADWKTYRSEEYNFSIKHPNLILNPCSAGGLAQDDQTVVVFGKGQPDVMGSCGRDYSIAVFIDLKEVSNAQTEIDRKINNYISYVISTYGEIEAKKLNTKTGSTTIANISATVFSPYEGVNTYLFSKSTTGPIYSTTVVDYEGLYKQEIDQILSTFKFLE